jgi:hypothetical protein
VLDVGEIVDVVGADVVGSGGTADVEGRAGGANVVDDVDVDVVVVVDIGATDVGATVVLVEVVVTNVVAVDVTGAVDEVVVVVTASVEGGMLAVVDVTTCAGSVRQIDGSEGRKPVGDTRTPATSIHSGSTSLSAAQ